MRLLLDTHSLIWYTEFSPLLSLKAYSLIDNPLNSVFVSMVSFYEIAIKVNIGKLCSTKTLTQFYKDTTENEILILPINENYLTKYLTVPLFSQHRDPFDKLIIATAMEDNLTIITTDKKFILYKELVDIIW